MKMKIRPSVVYFIGSLGGLLFGIDSGLTGGVMSPARYALQLDAGWEVLMANIVIFGAAIMALFSGFLNDKYGRKKTLVLSGVVFTIGAVFCSFAWSGVSLTISRLILGFGIGIASATVPAFLSELAPAAKRAGIATLFQFAIVIGLNLACIVAWLILPRGFDDPVLWMTHNFHLMFGIAIIPAVILFFCSLAMPESPRFLAKNGKIEEAKDILLKMRNGNKADADAEFAEISKIIDQPTGGLKDLITFAKKPLIAAMGLAFFQQMVGINSAFYYGPIIAGSILPHEFANPAVGSDFWLRNLQQDQLYAILFATVNFLATVVTVLIINKITSYKKTLYLGGALMFIFSILFVIQVKFDIFPDIIAIILICLYIASFAFSWGPILWNILGEIFPLSVRGIGASIGAAANWFANFTVMSVFGIIILKDINGIAKHVEFGFGLFSVGCIIAIIFTVIMVPETKNRSLEDIEEGFRNQKEGLGDNVSFIVIISAIVIGTLGALFAPMFGFATPLFAWVLITICLLLFVVAIISTKILNK